MAFLKKDNSSNAGTGEHSVEKLTKPKSKISMKFWKLKNKKKPKKNLVSDKKEEQPSSTIDNNEEDDSAIKDMNSRFVQGATGRVSMDSIRIRMFELEQKYEAAMAAIKKSKEKEVAKEKAESPESILKKPRTSIRFAPDTNKATKSPPTPASIVENEA